MLYIDISKKDVYLEYINGDFEYISFAKAKKMIFEALPQTLKYSCVDSLKSVNFLNSLLTRYKLHNNTLILQNQ